jgi:Cu-Zn family superoxide dismutase
MGHKSNNFRNQEKGEHPPIMKNKILLSTALMAAAFGSNLIHRSVAAEPPAQPQPQHLSAAAVTKAVAVVAPTLGNKCRGEVRFIQSAEGVKVMARFEGLEPNSKHAMHIHQYGDCHAADASSAGGHYNPENHPHALPETEMRHAGDLGNIQADAQGMAKVDIVAKNITISGAKNPILGRAVILHKLPDDGSQPAGNAGDRIACGVIGVADFKSPQ